VQRLGALLAGVADPWLGVFAQLLVFTLFALSVKRGFSRTGANRPARWREGGNPGQSLPAGYRAHFLRNVSHRGAAALGGCKRALAADRCRYSPFDGSPR
jgi:hypothetical protein